ncbi:MAG: MFS transporter, partial [Parahaliea sp.]
MLFDRAFVSFLVARTCLGLSSTVLSVAIGWHLYQATGDPFDLALVGLFQVLPVMLLFIVSGWVVDQFSRKRVLVTCAVLELLVDLGLASGRRDGEVQRQVVFTLLVLNGWVRAFNGPAMQAILPNIVSPGLLSRAVALTSTVWTAAMTAGPFVAGLLIAAVDFATYSVLAGLALLSVLCLAQLPRLEVEQRLERGVSQLLDGVRFVFKDPIVLPSISLDLLIVLAGSVLALLPVYAVDVLGVGPEALG